MQFAPTPTHTERVHSNFSIQISLRWWQWLFVVTVRWFSQLSHSFVSAHLIHCFEKSECENDVAWSALWIAAIMWFGWLVVRLVVTAFNLRYHQTHVAMMSLSLRFHPIEFASALSVWLTALAIYGVRWCCCCCYNFFGKNEYTISEDWSLNFSTLPACIDHYLSISCVRLIAFHTVRQQLWTDKHFIICYTTATDCRD